MISSSERLTNEMEKLERNLMMLEDMSSPPKSVTPGPTAGGMNELECLKIGVDCPLRTQYRDGQCHVVKCSDM